MLSNGHADLVSSKNRALSDVELQQTATIRLATRRFLPVHCFPTLARQSPMLESAPNRILTAGKCAAAVLEPDRRKGVGGRPLMGISIVFFSLLGRLPARPGPVNITLVIWGVGCCRQPIYGVLSRVAPRDIRALSMSLAHV
jgi:hypothetical protein